MKTGMLRVVQLYDQLWYVRLRTRDGQDYYLLETGCDDREIAEQALAKVAKRQHIDIDNATFTSLPLYHEAQKEAKP